MEAAHNSVNPKSKIQNPKSIDPMDTTWTLTDVANRVYVDRFYRSTKDGFPLAGSDKWSLSKTRLHGGVSEGVDVVEIDNGRMKFSVLPTRGMGLWKGTC